MFESLTHLINNCINNLSFERSEYNCLVFHRIYDEATALNMVTVANVSKIYGIHGFNLTRLNKAMPNRIDRCNSNDESKFARTRALHLGEQLHFNGLIQVCSEIFGVQANFMFHWQVEKHGDTWMLDFVENYKNWAAKGNLTTKSHKWESFLFEREIRENLWPNRLIYAVNYKNIQKV